MRPAAGGVNQTDWNKEMRLSLLERCFLHSPRPDPGTRPGSDSDFDSDVVPSTSSPLRLLSILKCIPVQDDQAAQVVLCDPDSGMVAKFYDPLYPITPRPGSSIFLDHFRTADHNDAHATAAFKALTQFAE
jgi:hypothetical protein